MPEVHARLSASGSHIWLNCPPSVKLSEGIPNGASAYMLEGTTAHKLAEIQLGEVFGLITDEEHARELERVKKTEFYSDGMQEYITAYVDWVVEEFESIETADKELMTEQRLDFSNWVPDGFGTGDVVIIADGVLTVIDLKYGKGVPVSAEKNPQLMLYGLGAYDSYSLSNDIHTVRMVINQPRLDSISEYEISARDLLKWGEEIKPIARMAMAGEGEQNPGEHCRFCKVKAICRARAEALEELNNDKKDPRLLTDTEMAALLSKLDGVKGYIDDVKSYAQKEAIDGHRWPGWKLVEGKSNRKYADVKKVEEALIGAGFDKAVLYKDPELLGLTAMEKVVGGKKKLEKICEGLIIKPPGAPTLVPEGDKRPEISGSSVYDDGYTD